jgi:hypothetical protein
VEGIRQDGVNGVELLYVYGVLQSNELVTVVQTVINTITIQKTKDKKY